MKPMQKKEKNRTVREARTTDLWAQESDALPLSQNTRENERISSGGWKCSISGKNVLHAIDTPGDTRKKILGRESPPKILDTTAVPGDLLYSRGPSKPSRGGLLSTPPARRVCVGARSFADNTLCCHVGRAWQQPCDRGGSGGARQQPVLKTCTETGIVAKSQLDMITLTTINT